MNIMDLFSASEIKTVNFDLKNIKTIAERVVKMQNQVGGRARLIAKVGVGGVKVFTISNGNRDMILDKFAGVVIASHNCNVLFSPRADDGSASSTPPICSSADGIIGMAEDGTRRNCADCPYNTFGSNGKGKACKNMHRLYILVEGVPVPMVLTLPPTSLETWRNYAIMDVAAAGLNIDEVLTEFTLANAEANGNKYSIVNFKIAGKVENNVTEFCRTLSASLTSPEQPELEDAPAELLPETVEQDEPDDELPDWIRMSTAKPIVAVNRNPKPAKAVPIPLNMTDTAKAVPAPINVDDALNAVPEADISEISFDSL